MYIAEISYCDVIILWRMPFTNEHISSLHNSLLIENCKKKTRKPCCRRETARCRCKFWSISTASWAKAEWM